MSVNQDGDSVAGQAGDQHRVARGRLALLPARSGSVAPLEEGTAAASKPPPGDRNTTDESTGVADTAIENHGDDEKCHASQNQLTRPTRLAEERLRRRREVRRRHTRSFTDTESAEAGEGKQDTAAFLAEPSARSSTVSPPSVPSPNNSFQRKETLEASTQSLGSSNDLPQDPLATTCDDPRLPGRLSGQNVLTDPFTSQRHSLLEGNVGGDTFELLSGADEGDAMAAMMRRTSCPVTTAEMDDVIDQVIAQTEDEEMEESDSGAPRDNHTSESTAVVTPTVDDPLRSMKLRARPQMMSHQARSRRESFSRIPMEQRGSFIDGGNGPFTSDAVPGAFRAPGRALGAFPAWGRQRSRASNMSSITLSLGSARSISENHDGLVVAYTVSDGSNAGADDDDQILVASPHHYSERLATIVDTSNFFDCNSQNSPPPFSQTKRKRLWKRLLFGCFARKKWNEES